MAKTSKKEELDEAVALAVGAGRELHLETVDFSDPNRPKTCLEVDFPILPINHVAAIEGNAGKPIYQMSKWWARRRSSVFRAMLIAAGTKAPEDPAESAKIVWDSYYGTHQKNAAFRKIKVADIFMGGGTTVVEGARLGMQMFGNDLNPVAWFVVKNELAHVDPKEIKKLLDHIEAEVKPQIIPFYACDCPRGHKGKWKKKKTGEVMGEGFDPLALKPDERPDYEYDGPEVIYTFWAKHGPCLATECDHRTPVMSSPVIAVKALTVKAWTDRECTNCNERFDVERHETRMAPGALFVVGPDERPYAVMDDTGKYTCPHCAHKYHDEPAAWKGHSVSLGKAKNKSVALALLIDPNWLRGSPGKGEDGTPFGGSTTDTSEATAAWNKERARNLRLIEVRGDLPEELTYPDTGETFYTDSRGGTVPRKAHFACAACGNVQDVLETARGFGKDAPSSGYAIQGYCPICDRLGIPYGGRFFDTFPASTFDTAAREWEKRKDGDLNSYWPRSEFPYGLEADFWSVRDHGYTHFWKMFNPRQLLLQTLLLRTIISALDQGFTAASQEQVLSAFQQYLRNQCMFTLWNHQADKLEPHFSKNNFRPKALPVENCFSVALGRGNWLSCCESILETAEWSEHPWELLPASLIQIDGIAGKSTKVFTVDPVREASLSCCSSTKLDFSNDSFDLVVTDPPFGDLLQYAELSDYFYVWLRLALKDRYPELFSAEYTPRALEVVTNKAREPNDPDGFYQKLLTQCWLEASRILKPSGILSFTFHHSEDEPWVAVLESLFQAGFYLEATYPIRSDETKGEGEFGSQKIEYDIIHVCRKRIEDTHPVSWARMRRQIMQDVGQLREILEQHQTAGLQEADLQVIRRGKALEYYSKHYGKVYVEKGRDFTVREALVGINTLLDDERDTTKEAPPINAEPYTRQFLRLFAESTSLPRDQMQKFLRGTGVSPAEFLNRGWCSEIQKVFYVTSPLELARAWKGVSRNGMARDFDQAMFLVGACYENSGIRVLDTLNSPNFTPHPATADILGWLIKHSGDGENKVAAKLARQLYDKWLAANKPKVEQQRSLFDLTEELL